MFRVTDKLKAFREKDRISKTVVFCRTPGFKDHLIKCMDMKINYIDGFKASGGKIKYFRINAAINVLFMPYDTLNTLDWALNIANHIVLVNPDVQRTVYDCKILMTQDDGVTYLDKPPEIVQIWQFFTTTDLGWMDLKLIGWEKYLKTVEGGDSEGEEVVVEEEDEEEEEEEEEEEDEDEEDNDHT